MIRKLVIMTGPSGVGKATIEAQLFKKNELKLKLSCSATTRKPRAGEVDGQHYYFISMDKFDELIKNDAFVEWSEHFDNKYGTLKSEIEKIQSEGNIPFLEIEVDGAIQIMTKFNKQDLITIFLAAPSHAEIEKRIRNRNSENEEQIKTRLDRYKYEEKFKKHFQYVVVNDVVERAVEEIAEIIKRGTND